jgi:flagellar biosynthetic protein FliO
MSDSTSSLYLLVRVAMSLALVLGMVGIAVWALKRRGPLRSRGGATHRLEVVDRRALSKGAQVALVRVGHEDFLVGVTDQRVELLGRTDSAAPAEEVDDDRVVVHLGATEHPDDQVTTVPVSALPPSRGGPLVSTTRNATDGGPQTAATRRTGYARPAPCAAQESRMGFVEALRELTVRRS